MDKNESKSSFKNKLRITIKKNKFNIIIIAVVLLIIACVGIYNNFFGNIETYTVVNGYVEKSSDTQGYLIKEEKVASSSSSDVAIPVIDQGKKAAKNEIIAIYKDESYTKYLQEIENMDKEIQTLIKDLPSTYSSDIKDIDNQISETSKEALKTTSYIKMQEYKNKLDELSYKKVLILGTLSPEGSKIRELITQREDYEEKSKTSSNNIKAPMTGVVTYKIDGLEDSSSISSVYNYSADDIENIMKKYSTNDQNKFGIKIVNNYEAYIIIKEEKGKNDEYIVKDKDYTIRINEISDKKITGTLTKIIDSDNYYYCIFKVENGIEDIVDARALSLNIVWKRVSGIAVPKHYIKENKEKNYSYVTMLHAGEYIDIPVDIIIESDNVCIIDNMSKEDIEKLGIESKTSIELYDQIIYKPEKEG